MAAARPAFAATGAEGARLYATRCSSCHGAAGLGSSIAPPLVGTPAVYVHFMLDTGRMPANAPGISELHERSIFTEEQIDEVTAYVEGFTSHPDLSMPVIMPGNVDRGRQLFAANCQQCHGAAGNGSSIGGDDVAPSLMNATVFQVAEAMRAGPGIMPRFGNGVMSDQDVSDIARYVNVVQAQRGTNAEDAGGFALGHVGPVAEGFVVWIFAMGALLIFLRGIGTNR